MMFSGLKKNIIVVLIAVLFVMQIGCALSGASYHSLSIDGYSVTIKDICSIKDKLYISYEFVNNNSKKNSLSDCFYEDVFQDGYECYKDTSDKKFTNWLTNVKDGASLNVVIVYTLRNPDSIVEITVKKYFDLSSKEVCEYFNPQNQKWGTKAEVSSVPTEIPILTNTPKMEDSDNSWICPDCGKKLTSKFCPDCGVSSPTPKPTNTPSPSPTAVPIDTSKPVVNVVRLSYTLINGADITEGEYTGETVDGFPHGYGIFLINGILYYAGDWLCGKPVSDKISDSLEGCNLRFDGIYRSFNPNKKESGLFRFFEDGTVVYCLVSDNAQVVNLILDKENYKDSIGTFSIQNKNEIEINVVGKSFSGVVDERSVALSEPLSISSIKNSERVKYYFSQFKK